ncbi:Four-jointed box protein 1 [Varanus komodoensis]|uniref:four-jointed box protein 1 n=1 Tax=Varanus komodoensis TaxID=61221 RepID=UPI001CF7A2C2|nr:four-jointed box protein 1 [Varanus komodoensis]KAF7252041.1 Four-jointed box protein 1 [Varanus komodoensis]
MQRAGLAGLGSVAVLWLLALASLVGLWSGRIEEPGRIGSRFPQEALESGLGGGEAAAAGTSHFLRRPPSQAAQKTFRALLTLPRQSTEPQEGPGESGQEPPPLPPSDHPRWGKQGTMGVAEQLPPSPVRGGIFWSRALEAQVPPGFSAKEAASWLRAAREARVVSLERGGCGRSSNRLARLSDGSRACVRYGINPEQIQGEALSYHLAGLLGMQERLPPLALSRVDARGGQWAQVRDEVRGSHWAEGAVVSLAQWVDNLTDVVAPAPWRAEAGAAAGGRRLQPLAAGELQGLGPAQLVELVQWSDLILFDYLTANFDRLVSNLFSLQWDPRVMHRATSNLHRAPNGGLVFLDNEAGLVHGYRLLAMWDKYNEPLLRSVCVFREATAQRVRDLHHLRNAASELLRLYRTQEPLAELLGFLSDQQAQLLQERIDFVHKHILHCKAKASAL